LPLAERWRCPAVQPQLHRMLRTGAVTMTPSTTIRKGFLALALLATSLMMGCSTYHYFDIDVEFGPVNEEQASLLQLCTLTVTGADSHSADFPSSVVGLDPNDPNAKSFCPPQGTWTGAMGTFEFSTFAD